MAGHALAELKLAAAEKLSRDNFLGQAISWAGNAWFTAFLCGLVLIAYFGLNPHRTA
jgi:hypothetical protein